jgi:putative transcriptional regulator
MARMKNNVREYREYKGVSLRWLARKVGCGTSTLCDIEKGRSVPNVRLAIRIARALGTTVEELWEGAK